MTCCDSDRKVISSPTWATPHFFDVRHEVRHKWPNVAISNGSLFSLSLLHSNAPSMHARVLTLLTFTFQDGVSASTNLAEMLIVQTYIVRFCNAYMYTLLQLAWLHLVVKVDTKFLGIDEQLEIQMFGEWLCYWDIFDKWQARTVSARSWWRTTSSVDGFENLKTFRCAFSPQQIP